MPSTHTHAQSIAFFVVASVDSYADLEDIYKNRIISMYQAKTTVVADMSRCCICIFRRNSRRHFDINNLGSSCSHGFIHTIHELD